MDQLFDPRPRSQIAPTRAEGAADKLALLRSHSHSNAQHQGRKARAWQPVFLAALSATGNVTVALKAAGVARNTVYTCRRRHSDFAAAWAAARVVFLQRGGAKAQTHHVTGDAFASPGMLGGES